MAEPRIQYVKTSDGVSIAYWTTGNVGRWVVLVPSLGRGGADFDRLSRALGLAGFRTLAFDPRGVGQSEASLGSITLHDLSADVALLIEQLDETPVHVVGHAFGNRVARCLAADRPDLVRTVTLLAAGGLIAPDEQVSASGARCFDLGLPVAERLEEIRCAFFAPTSDPSVWLDGWWPVAAALQTAAGRATPLDDWWTAGDAPLLVIQGLEDQIAVPANGHALKEKLGTRVRCIDLPDAGHALLPEQPQAIASEIVTFLRELD
jgi:pimeloyl-ACP methyl ester carboxylesterase